MSHILQGRLRGYIAPDLLEPLPDATLMFYRPGGAVPAEISSAEPHQSPSILSPEEVRGKEHLVAGRTRTDEQGGFRVDLSDPEIGESRGATEPYTHGPIEVDVHCNRVYGQKSHSGEPVRFTLAALRLSWESNGDGKAAQWDCNLPQRFWNEVRAALDAWVICGRVISVGSAAPVVDVRVQAYDGDIAQNDPLGSAVTDALGRFRIDYASDDFRDTPTPWGNFEADGPDLFFRVSRGDGTVLLEERKSRGSKPDRENAPNTFLADLYVRMTGGAV